MLKPAIKHWQFWLPLFTVFLVEFLRVFLVDRYYSQVTVTHLLYEELILKHDGLVIGCIVLLHFVGWSVPSRPISTIFRFMSWSVLLLCMADLFIFSQFAQRLSLKDIIHYGQEGSVILDFVGSVISQPKNGLIALAMVMTILSLVAVWSASSPLKLRFTVYSSFAGVFIMGISQLPDRTTYVSDWAYRNLFEIQAMSGVLNSYSDSMIRTARGWSEKQDQSRLCEPGINSRRNVILVLLESLSSHQSKYVSGLQDWTPHIDSIARKNTVWSNFYANGENTAYGYVATLTGHDPLTAVNARKYNRWLSVADALPFRLKQYGYKSAFLTSGDNGFLNVGQWLQSIGFDYVEGSEAPFYKGMERYNFSAVADSALYDRSLQWLKGESSPFLLVLKTVSTHLPYMNPVSRERSGEAAFHYADEAFSKFVEQLYSQGYFSRGGVLLLTGDHREMVMINQDEVERYGSSAKARVPLVVIGEGLNLPHQITAPFQQADIAPSIEYLTSNRACFAERQRNLFRPEKSEPSRCILHMRNDRSDTVEAYCSEQLKEIRLDGDNTRIVVGNNAEDDTLIQNINAERIGWFLRRKPDGSVSRTLQSVE